VCIALVDIPVGDIGAVVFSLVRTFPTVTFCANKAGLTPVAFTPVAFAAVVVVPFVVDGIIVFPIIVSLVGTRPFADDVNIEDDGLGFVCCASANER
jgi:hypothetical protein